MIEFLTSADALVLYIVGVFIFTLAYVDELSIADVCAAAFIATAWPVWVPALLVKGARRRKWL